MLDPACGDGRFLMAHPNSVGIEQDADAARLVHFLSPGSLMHQGDFFAWAGETRERFECAVGNPPFIRYQSFSGDVRETALRLCAKHGARFSSLCSSWAPFIVATATLLKPEGQMAFVVPAEIGHAPYATPLIEYLAAHFSLVQVVAVRQRIFPSLSEDCWLLYAAGFGGTVDRLLLSVIDRFGYLEAPPSASILIGLPEWRRWNCRLRSFLLSGDVRAMYLEISREAGSTRLESVAKVGIGYVTGDNAFFHRRPSQAAGAGIPETLLLPTVRNGKALAGRAINSAMVEAWRGRDEPNFLLRLRFGLYCAC
jgi:hypothetical protein